MSGIKWGHAKREVIARKSDIIALAGKGHNLEYIYKQLKENSGLEIGSRTFRRHASALLKNSGGLHPKAAVVSTPTPKSLKPSPIDAPPESAAASAQSQEKRSGPYIGRSSLGRGRSFAESLQENAENVDQLFGKKETP